MKTIRLTVGQALVKFLDNQFISFDGNEIKFVEGIFGIFGHGCVVGLGEAIQEGDHSLKFYQGHNEQGMAHAAIAFAKQHKRRKMMVVTSSIGPGALNMVTAAGTATANRIPLLLLPGDAFACRQPDPVLQQIEQPHNYNITANDAFKPVCRYWDRIARPEQLMTASINALRVLTDPADTGAVCLCLPQDVQGEAWDYPEYFFRKRIHTVRRRPLAEGEAEFLTKIIAGKKKPLIICGGGVSYSEAGETLEAFTSNFNIPFAETQAGKGTIVWDHPMNLGGIGLTGTLTANRIAKQADLVISVGSRLNDFHTCSKWLFQNPKVDFLSINLHPFDAYKADGVPILADAKTALEDLDKHLKEKRYTASYGNEIRDLKREWDEEVDRLYSLDDKEGYSQSRVIGQLNEGLIPEDAIILTASGSLPSDLQRTWRTRIPHTYHVEYGFSCMGYEVAGALGAKIANPEKEVYCLLGDGAYIMLHSELLTSIQEGIKINIIVFDNSGFHCIGNLQGSKGIPPFGCEFNFRNNKSGLLDGKSVPVDYAANAKSYGCDAWTVHNAEEFKEAITMARESKISTLIDVKTNPESMTNGYECWWRVGIPEVSKKKAVNEAYKTQEKELQNVRQY